MQVTNESVKGKMPAERESIAYQIMDSSVRYLELTPQLHDPRVGSLPIGYCFALPLDVGWYKKNLFSITGKSRLRLTVKKFMQILWTRH